MKKKYYLAIAIVMGIYQGVFSQIENPNATVEFKSTETNTSDPTGFELPAIKTPSLTNPDTPSKYAETGTPEPKPLDMTKGDGLLDYNSGKAPKYFTKDAPITADVGGDQNLGDFKTGAKMVSVQYRDHQYVDGDQIRVLVNDDIIQSNITLQGGFTGFNLTLESGFNRIDFLALNQGSSGPNTAELHVYDEKGQLVSAKEWNLLTGDKATIVIIKE
jgi:hypothetical protein